MLRKKKEGRLPQKYVFDTHQLNEGSETGQEEWLPLIKGLELELEVGSLSASDGDLTNDHRIRPSILMPTSPMPKVRHGSSH